MFSFFNRKTTAQLVPALSNLDTVLYPLQWQQQSFNSAQQILIHLIENFAVTEKVPDSTFYIAANLISYQKQFSQLLLEQPVYQDWINFTVFGRYIQRSFSAFYQQTEDVFNADMPEILKHELMRHTQRLPKGQVLLTGGKLPMSVRSEKLLTTTLNPFKAIEQALKYSDLSKTKGGVTSINTTPLIFNLITVGSDSVKAFAVKHNKHTSDAVRNEVMILDFSQLTLTKEDTHNNNAQPELSTLIRHYTIG